MTVTLAIAPHPRCFTLFTMPRSSAEIRGAVQAAGAKCLEVAAQLGADPAASDLEIPLAPLRPMWEIAVTGRSPTVEGACR